MTTTEKAFEHRIHRSQDWRAEALAHLRVLIRRADPGVLEELKWKKPSNPEGDPVWSHDGILCVGNTLKASVRLTFPKGARIPDPGHVFNSRRDSPTVRAIDVFEGDRVVDARIVAIVRAAVRLNSAKERSR